MIVIEKDRNIHRVKVKVKQVFKQDMEESKFRFGQIKNPERQGPEAPVFRMVSSVVNLKVNTNFIG